MDDPRGKHKTREHFGYISSPKEISHVLQRTGYTGFCIRDEGNEQRKRLALELRPLCVILELLKSFYSSFVT